MHAIKLYGDKTNDITQGQQFIADITYIEGRKVVELKPIDKIWGVEN